MTGSFNNLVIEVVDFSVTLGIGHAHEFRVVRGIYSNGSTFTICFTSHINHMYGRSNSMN